MCVGSDAFKERLEDEPAHHLDVCGSLRRRGGGVTARDRLGDPDVAGGTVGGVTGPGHVALPRGGGERVCVVDQPGQVGVRRGGGEHVVERLVMAPEAVQVLVLRGGEGRGRQLEQLPTLSRGGSVSRQPRGERFQGAPNLVGVLTIGSWR